MNKRELIKEYEGARFAMVTVNSVLEDLKQLDEPQKPVVLQFVADWYEEHKDDFEDNLFYVIHEIFKKQNDNELSEFEKWVIEPETKPFQTLVNMHQFGYIVEKEKRYLVKMKRIEEHNSFLKYNKNLENWYFGSIFVYNNDVDTRTYHTLKELEEDGFGEVFNSPLFEVEEVEG